jgi:hypothetical protein
MKTVPNKGQRGTRSDRLCGTRCIRPRVYLIALLWGLIWLSDGNRHDRTLLLTAAPFRIVREELYEIIEQPKLDQNLLGLLRYSNSYAGSVDKVVCFV